MHPHWLRHNWMLQDKLGLVRQRHTEITGYTIGAQTRTKPRSTNNFAYLTGRNFGLGQPASWVVAIGILVETLLDRGAKGDMAEAEAAIDRMANLPATEGWVLRDMLALRLRALLAKAVADEMSYRDFRDRYRAKAESLGFEGHMQWAEAMP